MGLMSVMHARAASRPHVLLVEGPGGSAPRLALERALRERGWPVVDSPADADVLAVARSGDELEEFLARIWTQLPGPRVQITLSAPEHVKQALDRVRDGLQDIAAQRLDAESRRIPGKSPVQEHDIPTHDMSTSVPSTHDMGLEHGGHGGGHHMADHEIAAGLAMADRAPDRDGLQLDVLRIPWGPALAWWPAGLVLSTRMHGDVLAEVEASRIGPPEPASAYWRDAAQVCGPARAGAAARLDSLSRLLAVAGWEAERLRAQRIRDDLLAGEPNPALVARLERLSRRVGRSRTLAWMTHGVGIVGDADVTTRYRAWLTESVDAVRSGTASPGIELPREPLDVLPQLLDGVELSAMRLVVASLDPWLTGALPRAGASHD